MAEKEMTVEKPPLVISIGCEYASGGTTIGKLLSEKLGMEYFDRDFIDRIIERVGISQHVLDLADAGAAVKGIATGSSSAHGKLGVIKYMNLTERLVFIQKQVVKKLANRCSCVIIGRCADYILRDREAAKKLIEENDAMYHARYQQITGTFRGDRHNRHILLDSSLLGVEGSADYLDDLVRRIEIVQARETDEER